MNDENQAEVLRTCIWEQICQSWKDTGFGEISVVSERISRDTIRVTVRGTVSRKFHIPCRESRR